jgi:hypothetical protein
MDQELRDAFYAGVIAERKKIFFAGRRQRLRVSVTCLDSLVISGLDEHFGCGRTNSFTPKVRPHRLVHCWEVGEGAAEYVLKRTLPPLCGEKRAAAEAALDKRHARKAARM